MTQSRFNRRRFLAVTAGAAALFSPAVARGSSYAQRTVRLMVGTGPSGTTDLSARLIAPLLSARLGQPVIVENRPGAGATYAAGLVANARPDGHLLHVSTAGALAVHATNAVKPPDVSRDLQPIGMICDGNYIYTINPDIPAEDAQAFFDLVRSRPGEFRFGTSGPGSALHLSAELLCQRAGMEMGPVHYSDAATRAADLMGNEIQMGLGGIGVLGQFVTSGRLRGLLVASQEREELLPDLPTSVELGLPDLDRITNWFGLHAPLGTPEPIIEELNSALHAALADPELQRVLAAAGMRTTPDTPEEFAQRMTSDHAILVEVSEAANILIE